MGDCERSCCDLWHKLTGEENATIYRPSAQEALNNEPVYGRHRLLFCTNLQRALLIPRGCSVSWLRSSGERARSLKTLMNWWRLPVWSQSFSRAQSLLSLFHHLQPTNDDIWSIFEMFVLQTAFSVRLYWLFTVIYTWYLVQPAQIDSAAEELRWGNSLKYWWDVRWAQESPRRFWRCLKGESDVWFHTLLFPSGPAWTPADGKSFFQPLFVL